MLAKHPDYELINVDKIGIGANPANLHDIENDKRYTFIKGDICNPQLMNRLVHQVDAVVNIAAETHVDRSISDPNVFLQNNTLAPSRFWKPSESIIIKQGFCKSPQTKFTVKPSKAHLLKTPRLNPLILTQLPKPPPTCLCYLTTKLTV